MDKGKKTKTLATRVPVSVHEAFSRNAGRTYSKLLRRLVERYNENVTPEDLELGLDERITKVMAR